MASSIKKKGPSRWIIRFLLLGFVLEVGLLLGGLEFLRLNFGDWSKKFREAQKLAQGVMRAEKLVNEAIDIVRRDQGGQQAGRDFDDLGQGRSVMALERVEMERNPFTLPEGVHTLKELEAMAKKRAEDLSAPQRAERSVLEVSGIFLGKKERTAIVGGNLVRVGDLVGGEQVFEINQEGVILEKDGHRRNLPPPGLQGWAPASEALPFPPTGKTKSSKRAGG